MVIKKIKALICTFLNHLYKTQDSFLVDVDGVVHVGANSGQERYLYHYHKLDVVWVEAIPQVFAQLKSNITGLKNQIAVQALALNEDGKEYEFHISSNEGQSSSVLNLKGHKSIWPKIDYVQSICLKSSTLVTLFKREKLDPAKYQALILDTQGTELLVLQREASAVQIQKATFSNIC